MSFNNIFFYSLTALLLCSIACRDKDDDDMGGNLGITGEPTPILFEGITLTNEIGLVDGNGDATDWQLNDAWKANELELFEGGTIEDCTSTNQANILPAFPNPSTGIFSLALENFDGSTMDVRIVNTRFEVIASADNLALENDFSNFSFEITPLSRPDTVRMYYRIRQGTSCDFRGHGDIVIE